MNKNDTPLAAVDLRSATAMAESEMATMISVARRYPRSIGAFQDMATTLVTMDEETAMECIYALPARSGGDGRTIEGPSVRFAEIVGSCWGNSRYSARLIDEGAEFLTAQGVFFDLQTNNAVSVEVQRRITDRNGKRYGPDMLQTTANAAKSIALRNAILKGVPGPVWKPIYSKARAIIAGSFETLAVRRAKALEAFAKIGASAEDVLEMLGKANVKDIDLNDMVTLRGTLQAIRDGDTSRSQVFGRQLDEAGRKRAAAKAGERADLGGKLKEGKAADTRPAPEEEAKATAQAAADEAPVEDVERTEEERAPEEERIPQAEEAAEREPGDEPEEEGTEEAAADPMDFPGVHLLPEAEGSGSEWDELVALARALGEAATTKAVNELDAKVAPRLETLSAESERAGRKMIQARVKEILASKRGKGSAASKL